MISNPTHHSPSPHFARPHPVAMDPDIIPEAESIPDAEPEPEIPQRRRPTPRHPIPSMQDAFDESLAEHTGGLEVLKPKLRVGDAKTRRDRLLNEGKDEGPPAAYWRYRPGQKNHELRRLLAQISFGVHLLLNGSATAIESVVQILQGHIDEVDEFLEMTLEDMALATKDLQERLDHLRLPMNNMAVFEKMLEDRQFRLRILDGNEAIEHIVSRTTTALAQTVEDVDEGLKSTREFAAYLTEQHYGGWRDEQPGIVTIFEAMKGNTEGWLNAFADLHAKDNALHVLTLQLSGVVSEMELTAGEVSRRTRFSIKPYTAPVHTPRSSQSSTLSTPTASPPRTRIPRSPPRLSLRLSSLLQPDESGSSYFDIPTKTDDTLAPFQSQSTKHPDIEEEPELPEIAIESEDHRRQAPEDIAPRRESADNSGEDDKRLYLLQPRTYTPQPPAPLPSPRLRDEMHQPIAERERPERQSQPQKRTSLRQRISLKTTPPESIQVPPPNAPELQEPDYVSPQIYQGPDSAYGSDIERPPANPAALADPSTADPPQPVFRRPDLIPSPQSDQQYFRPVRASPHSPLQQRPHTSHTTRNNASYQQHQRNAPSAMGMSMLSNVTNVSNDTGTGRKLKKKRSAFGWFKKAFALDEEERVAFEQKRQQASPNLYYDNRSPQFLDGRRVRR